MDEEHVRCPDSIEGGEKVPFRGVREIVEEVRGERRGEILGYAADVEFGRGRGGEMRERGDEVTVEDGDEDGERGGERKCRWWKCKRRWGGGGEDWCFSERMERVEAEWLLFGGWPWVGEEGLGGEVSELLERWRRGGGGGGGERVLKLLCNFNDERVGQRAGGGSASGGAWSTMEDY
ncbi:hypothetical protein AMTR_s00009p00267860 [Amborella trichopoda]|uniref:Uncharacterized protein n=1 Tax=Amborella trichopoda TaxID=13333 RepID=W1NJ94_AMBTC|nr:hypothetical protein AMTR_s00009p00267860 [Amborella trichopoda]